MDKIKISLRSTYKSDKPAQQIKPKDIEIQRPCSEQQEKLDLESHIKKYFLSPLNELIENEGVSNGYLIASVDALKIMKKILKSILKQKNVSIIDILEKAAFDCEESQESYPEEENVLEESSSEVEEDSQEDDEDQDDEEDEEDEDQEDEDDEYEEEYDIEEARECDAYCFEEDESMDG